MGNMLYGDEGMGVYAARCLQGCYRFTPEVEVFDGATLGFGLMDLFLSPRNQRPSRDFVGAPEQKDNKVIVLDAIAADAPPGTMYRLSRRELLDLGPSVQPTAHEVEPLELLKLAEVLGQPPDLVLLGIVPADAQTMAVGLTPSLEAAFPAFVDLALDELGRSGIRAERIADRSFARIVESLVTRA